MCIFLHKVPTITFEEYLEKARANYYNAMNEQGFRFYSLFLKQEKQFNSYPLISQDDIPNLFQKEFKLPKKSIKN